MIEAHDKFLEQKGPISDTHRTFLLPFNATLRKKRKYRKKKMKKQAAIKEQGKNVPLYEFHGFKDMSKHYRGNFHSLCKGNSFDSKIIDHSLRCRFQHHKDPYLMLGPFKLEELNQNPFMVTFKNFLFNEEVETLKSMVSNNLELSKIGPDSDTLKSITDVK